MVSAPCDVVQDNCTDAARRLGVNIQILFLRAAENCRNGRGFSNSAEVGERWYNVWKRSGYNALVPACQDYVLAVNNGEHCEAPKCPECGSLGSCHHTH